eukprot:SAG22_NODE_11826_length_467_cov_1.904891_1_plen_27_part_10
MQVMPLCTQRFERTPRASVLVFELALP